MWVFDKEVFDEVLNIWGESNNLSLKGQFTEEDKAVYKRFEISDKEFKTWGDVGFANGKLVDVIWTLSQLYKKKEEAERWYHGENAELIYLETIDKDKIAKHIAKMFDGVSKAEAFKKGYNLGVKQASLKSVDNK